MTVKLLKGDCLELMKDIPDETIDMVLTDPPYGTTACKWDTIIPFEPLWEQYERVIKDNGAIVLFGSEPFSSRLRLSNINKYKYDWIWKKRPVNFLNAKKQPLRETENIMVFNSKVYFPQGLIYKPRINKRSNSTETNGEHGRSNVSLYTNYPRQLLEYVGERGLHPTQKPVSLFEYLVKTYTNEGDTVLDNVMGSGTTGVACVNTNRNFIGMELEEKYFKIAEQRIEQAKNLELLDD